MTLNGIAQADELWRSIRREAENVMAGDPVFGASLSSAILAHPGLGSALAHQIGERLGKSAADRERFARVADQAFAASPDLVDAARRHRSRFHFAGWRPFREGWGHPQAVECL